MNSIAKSLFATLVCFLCGCHVVKSPAPFGLNPVNFARGFHEGTWIGEAGDLFEVSLVEDDTSVLSITYDEKRPSGASNFKTIEARVMVGKQWQYASVPCAEDGSNSSGYFFVCVHSTPRRTIIWMPDRMKFRGLVMNGVIPGKIVKEDVFLEKITPEVIEIIESCRHGMLFDWQNPLIFTKKVAADNQKDEQGVPAKSDRAGG